MTILEIIELVVLATVTLVLIIFYSIKAIKNKWVSKIYSSIKAAIIQAEESNLDGPSKKQFVLNCIEDLCDEQGIPYLLIRKLIDRTIEKLIEGYNTISKKKIK